VIYFVQLGAFDCQLAFGGMTLLLAGVVAALSFFGRSTGDSEASNSTTSIVLLDLSSAFLPGKENCLSLMSVILYPAANTLCGIFTDAVALTDMEVGTVFTEILQGKQETVF